jgi:anti-sigma B factor antagonist
MEISKTPVSDNIIKINLGTELSSDKKTVTGAVELDIENQSYFIEMISSIFDEGNYNILVDLSNVTYVDSSGLWALFEGHKKALQRNANMLLLNPTKDVKRVLDITKMSAKLKIFDDEASAINSLKS